MKNLKKSILISAAISSIVSSTAITAEVSNATVSVKAMADALHLVMDSDRAVYTKKIVNRLVKKRESDKSIGTF